MCDRIFGDVIISDRSDLEQQDNLKRVLQVLPLILYHV